MRVEAVAACARLDGLRQDWNALYARCALATPFQTPEWLLPWWRTFGSGELFTFAVWDGSQLVALAPLFLHPWNGRRQVTFLGNGVSDRLGFLVGDVYPAASAAILDAIEAAHERWDLCDLQDLPEPSPLCRISGTCRPQYDCSAIALPASMDEFRGALPHGIRRNLRRYRERLDGNGPVSFETASCEKCFAAAIDTLFELHQSRWEARDDTGMFAGDSMRRFHREAALNLFRRGISRAFTLRHDSRVLAVIYGFLDCGTFYSYQSGFDPSASRYSPGALILEYAIAQAIAAGAHTFDFLRGDEGYKRDWGARPYTTHRLLLSAA